MALSSVFVGTAAEHARTTWRENLPALLTTNMVLREVKPLDARPLAECLAVPEVQRYLPVGPRDEAGFGRFIAWVRRERRAGRYLCFAVLPRGSGRAVGVFQLWPIEPDFSTAEMGAALGMALWGTGAFEECASAVIDFAIETLGVRRLECRAATANARGAAALRKLGAVEEGILRECCRCPAGYLDHTLFAVLAREWRARRGQR